MVFIDLPNVTSAAMGFGIYRINFVGLAEVVSADTNRVGLNVYAKDEQTRHNFFLQLEKLGFHVERVSPGKSVDGRLIFHMLLGAHNGEYDTAILLSGDRDYIHVVEAVKRMNKEVTVASFSTAINPGLKNTATKFIKLDDFVDKIRLQGPTPPASQTIAQTPTAS